MRSVREGEPEIPLALRIKNIAHTQWPKRDAASTAFHSGYCHLIIALQSPYNPALAILCALTIHLPIGELFKV